MDFSLSNEQRHWQMTARKFADEEIRPISLERDAIARGMGVLPIPAERAYGLATLALQILTGAFLDYFANPDREVFEQRLKVIRKSLALFVEYEIKRAHLSASA